MERCFCAFRKESGWSKDQFVGRDCCDHRHHRDGGDTCVNEEEQEFLLQVYRIGRNGAALLTWTSGGVDFGESHVAQSPTPKPTPTPTPPASPTPSKFGSPIPITSPVPYLITSGTTITTDPSITTNGVTNFGKIYRGPETDGPASAWAFGSTSTFDTSSGFDSQINSSGAAFKFTALQLTGDHTISTANGEINLGLIAVNGITSGSPGGP